MVLSTQSVLIVDDNAFIRHVLRSFLEVRTGLQVVGEAANGSQAIEQAKLHKPDLILMDLAMPNMNGIEASSVIKDALPYTHILMFTLYSDALGEKVAKAAGVDVILPKDQGVEGLTSALERIFADRIPS